MSKVTWLAAVACVMGVALPARAAAQVEFTPFFASYYALVNTNDAFPVRDESGVLLGTVEERQIPAPGFGARLTFWMGSSFGIEAAGAFVTSGTRFKSDRQGASAGVSLSGTIMTGSARFLYRPSRTNLHFLLGGGVVSRGGDSWKGVDGKTDVAGVAGFGVRAAITPKVALNVNVETYLYSMNPRIGGAFPVNYDSKMQADIYVVVGIPISFGG